MLGEKAARGAPQRRCRQGAPAVKHYVSRKLCPMHAFEGADDSPFDPRQPAQGLLDFVELDARSMNLDPGVATSQEFQNSVGVDPAPIAAPEPRLALTIVKVTRRRKRLNGAPGAALMSLGTCNGF